MLKLYRRHTQECPHIAKGRSYKRCSCPIWVDGAINGSRVRRSLDTANWELSCEKVLKLEAGEVPQKDRSVADALKSFLADGESRNLQPTTTSNKRESIQPLVLFANGHGITTVRALADLPTLKTFVASMNESPRTICRRIEHLRSFIQHCEDMGWCDSNPATKIKKPIVKGKPVIPFTPDEYQKILAAIEKYPTKNSWGYDNRRRLRAFIHVLRYTALRISDVVQLKKAAISEGRVLLRTQKTGAVIYLPLPPFVLEELNGIGNGEYFFWNGNGTIRSAKSVWERSILLLFRLAGVKGYPHMFRHMLAIELLENGFTVEQVAAILGNSPGIVYKHYAPWIASRQKALDQAIMSMWNGAGKIPR